MLRLDCDSRFLGNLVRLVVQGEPVDAGNQCCLLFSKLTPVSQCEIILTFLRLPDGKWSGCKSSGCVIKSLVQEIGHEPAGEANLFITINQMIEVKKRNKKKNEPAREANLRRETADNELIVTVVHDNSLPPFFVGVALVGLDEFFKNAARTLPPGAVQSNVCFDWLKQRTQLLKLDF